VQGLRRVSLLRAPAQEEPVQGVDGGSICEHQRIRSQCKDCGGSAFCEHQRRRSRCPPPPPPPLVSLSFYWSAPIPAFQRQLGAPPPTDGTGCWPRGKAPDIDQVTPSRWFAAREVLPSVASSASAACPRPETAKRTTNGASVAGFVHTLSLSLSLARSLALPPSLPLSYLPGREAKFRQLLHHVCWPL